MNPTTNPLEWPKCGQYHVNFKNNKLTFGYYEKNTFFKHVVNQNRALQLIMKEFAQKRLSATLMESYLEEFNLREILVTKFN